MSEITSEAIFAELAKLRDSKNRVISFADGHTIVPNSLLEEVWRESERSTEARIIKLLEGFDDSCLWRQVEWSPDAYEGFNMLDLIALIKGENK